MTGWGSTSLSGTVRRPAEGQQLKKGLLDETTEGVDVCAIGWDWKGAESFDEVVVDPVAVCRDFEAAVACRWRLEGELAGVEGDAMLGALPEHFTHTVTWVSRSVS